MIESSRDMIRVMCVDDHPVVRSGIASIISVQADMTVVAAVATGEEAVQEFRHLLPDITLMDLQLPGMNGLEAIRTIITEYPTARIIVLTMYQGDEDIARALRAGASTYLLKDTLATDLVQVIRSVYSGERPLTDKVAQQLEENANRRTLSSRELEVLRLMAEGLRNKEIGAKLGIADETVHGHQKHIFGKLKVADRNAAVAVAVRRGIIHID